MDRIVTYLLLGEERRATVKDAATDEEAKAAVIADISKSLQFIHVAAVPSKPKRNIFETYVDGFRVFAQKLIPTQ